MTPQEEQMLNDLIGRVEQTQLPEKDPEAEQLLNRRLGRNPDSLYILAQTVLVQKYALEQAQAQLQQMRQQTQQPAHATSFLGNLLGRRDPAPPLPPPPSAPQPGYGAPPAYGQPYAQAWSPGPGYGAPPPSGGPSFLRSAATTAAGVAAGALAFEGVESLMHGFGHSAGFGEGGGFGGGNQFGGGVPQETVINNYYDDGGGDRGRDDSDLRASDDRDSRDDLTPDDASYDDSSFDDSQTGNDDLV